jgi:hypothetical protein
MIVNMVQSIANWLKNLATTFATDTYNALSASGAAFRKSANATVSNFFPGGGKGEVNGVPSQISILLDLMETGPLPPEWYFKKVSATEEIENLDRWIEIIKNLALVSIAVGIVGHVIVITLIMRSRSNRKQFEGLEKAEDEDELKRKKKLRRHKKGDRADEEKIRKILDLQRRHRSYTTTDK